MSNVPIKRLPGHDYSSRGAYFLTICTYRRGLVFLDSRVVDAVEACWRSIPEHHPAELDVFVVMPDHVHGILWLTRAGHARPLQTVVGSFKSAATRYVNRVRGTTGGRVWQRGYYERVIRDENELKELRRYVADNAAAWAADPENPRMTAQPRAPWL